MAPQAPRQLFPPPVNSRNEEWEEAKRQAHAIALQGAQPTSGDGAINAGIRKLAPTGARIAMPMLGTAAAAALASLIPGIGLPAALMIAGAGGAAGGLGGEVLGHKLEDDTLPSMGDLAVSTGLGALTPINPFGNAGRAVITGAERWGLPAATRAALAAAEKTGVKAVAPSAARNLATRFAVGGAQGAGLGVAGENLRSVVDNTPFPSLDENLGIAGGGALFGGLLNSAIGSKTGVKALDYLGTRGKPPSVPKALPPRGSTALNDMTAEDYAILMGDEVSPLAQAQRRPAITFDPEASGGNVLHPAEISARQVYEKYGPNMALPASEKTARGIVSKWAKKAVTAGQVQESTTSPGFYMDLLPGTKRRVLRTTEGEGGTGFETEVPQTPPLMGSPGLKNLEERDELIQKLDAINNAKHAQQQTNTTIPTPSSRGGFNDLIPDDVGISGFRGQPLTNQANTAESAMMGQLRTQENLRQLNLRNRPIASRPDPLAALRNGLDDEVFSALDKFFPPPNTPLMLKAGSRLPIQLGPMSRTQIGPVGNASGIPAQPIRPLSPSGSEPTQGNLFDMQNIAAKVAAATPAAEKSTGQVKPPPKSRGPRKRR